MFFIYQFLVFIIILFSPIIILIRIIRNKEHTKRFVEKFSIISKKKISGNLVWFHGSSVGEILSIIPLVEKLEKNNSIEKILITSSTLSSASIINKYKFKKAVHQFYPVDLIFFTKKFLNYWNPKIAIFIESEIWPSMFLELKKNNIPLLLINARITKKTFNKWFILNLFSKNIFRLIKKAYPQNIQTLRYLKKLNVPKIQFIGNLKFTESKQDRSISLNKIFIKQFHNRKIWCASSTHADEELECAKVHSTLKKKHKNLLTIIIPRHIHRVNEIKDKIERLGLNVINRSSNKQIKKNTDIYLVDTYGETKKFYKICKTVFLGGSLIKRGGQNPIEPASLGSKVIHGPFIDNFVDVYKLFHQKKISYKVDNLNQFIEIIDKLIKDKNYNNKYIAVKKIGVRILDKTIKEINLQLKDEIKKT